MSTTRNITHNKIIAYFKDLAAQHKQLNGFYRFDLDEARSSLRTGIALPALFLESHSADLESQTNQVTTFNNRTISFLVLDRSKARDFDKVNDIRDTAESVILDIIARMKRDSKDRDHWLYNLFDVNSVVMDPGGPIFMDLYGINCRLLLKNKETMVYNPEVWNDGDS
jgi:hypothetical protein